MVRAALTLADISFEVVKAIAWFGVGAIARPLAGQW